MVKRVTVEQARAGFDRLLEAVHDRQETVIVVETSQARAVILHPAVYERLVRGREARFAILDKVHTKNADVTEQQATQDAAREISGWRRRRRTSE